MLQATAVGSHPETLSSNSAHHSKSHHDGNRVAAHQSHSDELARSRRRTTKTEDVTNGGYRPTPISDLPPRSDALLGIPVIQFERDPSVTGILKRRHAIAQQQQHASSTSLSSDSPGTPNTQLVDERLNAENSSRQLTSTPPQPSTSTTKEPLAASSHHHSIHDSSIVQKSQAGGADGSIPTTSTSTMSSALPSSSSADSERESFSETGATAAKTNLERGGRRLCDATEQFPMAPPKLVEPKLITPLIEPKPIAKKLSSSAL
ncbi:unnamed protein product [Anisakis simplex]|uniref:Uncharacterized protein n=1 Tax=Anisakis simplex TaxID=6269 RepID=A0A3P6NAH6_ANISI|nr:unnamed protein product [Anisakis simplex]